jgi:hypothetical protein
MTDITYEKQLDKQHPKWILLEQFGTLHEARQAMIQASSNYNIPISKFWICNSAREDEFDYFQVCLD